VDTSERQDQGQGCISLASVPAADLAEGCLSTALPLIPRERLGYYASIFVPLSPFHVLPS
jgi:hypothetical protein